jgi:superfamily II DNA or RNA helicase/HKD family nuclease/diadenosine tetraphosphate (Ap4A) HIT family hydrolase
MTNPDDCPFCTLDSPRVFHRESTVVALWDAYPVAEHHSLIVPIRHVASWFDLTAEEHQDIVRTIHAAKCHIEQRSVPGGFNIGVNVGAAAGQTVFHVHVHLIPRRFGDVYDPTGGVRRVIPAKAIYLASLSRDPDPQLHPHLTTGRDLPLLPKLLHELDRAQEIDINAAFVLESGVNLIYDHLHDHLQRGGCVRFLTGDYMSLTDPTALRRLLDLEGNLTPRVFETTTTSFHPKAYIFRALDGTGAAYVGSSNLTAPALLDGVEWNYRVDRLGNPAGFRAIKKSFDTLFDDPLTKPLTEEWIDSYERRRQTTPRIHVTDVTPDGIQQLPEPHDIQREVLTLLSATREEGNTAGLVVLATGLGKTWLAAFDSSRPEFKRVLFVAHRQEILGQAKATFRRIRPSSHLGTYSGQEKDPDAEVLFASIQTLGRTRHLQQFSRDAFDYIIVDEFHHAAASTYRQLIDHFRPKFLLGLTATPERTDGGDLLALCHENLVYRCDFVEGIEGGWLCPFHYFGVPDDVDYTNIPWRGTHFDEEELTQAVATQKRAQNVLELYRKHGGRRTLGFCCSKTHADFMAKYFLERGIWAVAVHSGSESAPRADSLERLQRGELDIVFAVDMFNEGVDLPTVDTVIMLRPTESSILWTQQFGRGLRKADGKDHLRVIDYIGNHRVFLLKLRTLLEPLMHGDAINSDSVLAHALERVRRGELTLPPGCEITYNLQAIDIIKAMLRTPKGAETIRLFYEDFRDRLGVRPTATEVHHSGYGLQALRQRHGSWFQFVDEMGDLEVGKPAVLASEAGTFVKELETTPMTRSYKMLVLLAMLETGRFPGSISIEELVTEVRQLAQRRDALRQEFGTALQDDKALTELLITNPILAWTGGAGTGGVKYFRYEGGVLSTNLPDMDSDATAAFCDAVREMADYRLSEYLGRKPENGPEFFVCNVSHAGDLPILFLPDRGRTAGIPSSWVPIVADGEEYEADFVKVAVNVVRKAGSPQNVLPFLLRKWFGPDAGQTGTAHRVQFKRSGSDLVMMPLTVQASSLELWREYTREQIPPLFGLPFKGPVWQQGFVVQGKSVFLLVTLQKGGMDESFQYEDRFLAPDEFHWQSQNRTTQESKHGQIISRHAEFGYAIHLWVRESSSRQGRACPFRYCGEVDFQRWQGDKPITVWWKLRQPVPERLWKVLGVPKQ